MGMSAAEVEESLWQMHLTGHLSFRPAERRWALRVLCADFGDEKRDAFRKSAKAAEERSRLRWERMTAYTEERGCRHRFLRRYFGEEDAPARCGACDNCVPEEGLLLSEVESLLNRLRAPEASLSDIAGALSVSHARIARALHDISMDIARPLSLRLAAGAAKMWMRIRHNAS